MIKQLVYNKIFLLGLLVLLMTSLIGMRIYVSFLLSSQLENLPKIEVLADDATQNKELRWLFWVSFLDPIYAFPYLDTEMFKDGLGSLIKDKATISKMHESQTEVAQLINNTLYPEEFLQSIPEVESHRRTYISDPTYNNAVSYYRLLIRSIDHVIDYTDTFSEVFTEIENKDLYALWGGVISEDSFTLALASVRRQSHEQKQRAVARLECLDKWTPACESLQDSWAIVEDFLVANSSGYEEKLEIETVQFSKDLLRQVALYNDTPSDFVADDRFYILNNQWCAPTSSPSVFSLVKPITAGHKYLRAQVVSDLYFHDTQMSKSPFLQSLYENGVLYEIQNMTLYSCMDQPKVHSAVAVLDFIKTEFAEKSFSTRIQKAEVIHPATVAEIRQLEELISSHEMVHESVVSRYLLLLLETVALSPASFNEESQMLVFDAILEFRSRSIAVNTLFLMTSMANQDLLHIAAADDYVYLPSKLVYMINRSYLHALLFTDNTTVFPQEISFYDPKHQPWYHTDNHLRSYLGDIENEVSLEELLNFQKKAVSVYGAEEDGYVE